MNKFFVKALLLGVCGFMSSGNAAESAKKEIVHGAPHGVKSDFLHQELGAFRYQKVLEQIAGYVKIYDDIYVKYKQKNLFIIQVFLRN